MPGGLWADLSLRSSLYRWGDLLASSVVRVPSLRGLFPGWARAGRLLIFDEVVWRLMTVLESVALVSMLAFFFIFCGCTM